MPVAARETSGTTTRLVLEYVRNQGGDGLVARLLERAGLEFPERELTDESRWFGYHDRVRLLEAAAEVLGDPAAPRKIGASVLSLGVGAPLRALVQTVGSPALVIRNLPRVAAKFSTCDTVEVVSSGRSDAVLDYRLDEAYVPSWANCEYAVGLLSQLGPLFGLPESTVVHVSCRAKGGDRCRWRVHWGRWSRLPWRRAAQRRRVRLDAAAEQLNALQGALAELVSARHPRSVLPRIAGRAATAVQAPRHLLAVSADNGDLTLVYDGFDDDEARELAERLLAGRGEAPAGHIVARVGSSRREYGVLVCGAARGTVGEERTIVEAYARQAAVALDLSATMQESDRREQTARSLFNLAAQLAATRDTLEVAECLARTVPPLVNAEASAVVFVDRPAQVLRVVAASGWPSELREAVLGFEVALDAAPFVSRFVVDPSPFLASHDLGEPLIDAVLDEFDTDGAVVVPIVVRGELVGVVAAVRRGAGTLRLDDDMVEPLQGVANLTATAIENAWLLEARQAALAASEERERELREARGTLAHIIDSGPIVTFRGTSEGFRVTYVSQNVERIFGYDRETFLGQRWLQFVHADDVDAVWEQVQRIAVDDEVTFRMRFRAVDGEYRSLQVFLRGLGGPGGDREVLGYVWDQTEQTEAEAALRASEERFRRLVEGSPLPIQAHDPAGRLVIWNAACESLFGWSAAEVLGDLPPTIESVDAIEGIADVRDVLVSGEAVTNYEARLRRKDGSPVDVVISAAPMFDSGGTCTGTIVVLADMSERKQLEESLLQAQKMNALGRLAGGVAHDFNNLLTAILGHAEFLLDAPDDSEEVRENAAAIAGAGQRAAALTQQMLMFSRHQAPDAAIVDLNEVVRSMHELLSRIIGDDVQIRMETDASPATVRAVRAQLEQVILNLAVNARDAMPEGGVVTIATDIVETSPGAEACVRLVVGDSGVGMDDETRDRAFEPFFTTKPQGQGTGLGLSVVYGIVTTAGGQVQIDSSPGQGASVEILLPVLSGVVAPDEGGDARGPVDVAGTEVVFVVEDEPTVRSLARRTLERAGYSVIEASDGVSALQAADAGPIDLLLTDVVMPHVGGPELAKRLAAERPGLKVLFMSGYSEHELWEHGGEATAEFLQKPFSPGQLLTVVRRVLDDARRA